MAAQDSWPSSARRIHIVGGPASGKSTLANRLGDALAIEVYELDRLAYEGPDFTERGLDERLGDVRAIASLPEWIAEGIHLGWTEELLLRAELIVWLDHTSWTQSALRTVSRFARTAMEGARVQTGTRKFTRFGDYWRRAGQLLAVLVNSRDFYKPALVARRYPVTREEVERALRCYDDKLVRCTEFSDVGELLSALIPAAPIDHR